MLFRGSSLLRFAVTAVDGGHDVDLRQYALDGIQQNGLNAAAGTGLINQPSTRRLDDIDERK
jgi:hypothetical protein